jgi:two-component system, sensor histidine kinase LadS
MLFFIWRLMVGGLLVLLAGVGLAGPPAAADVIAGERTLDVGALGPGLSVLRDESGQRTLLDVSGPAAVGDFKPMRESIADGYTSTVVWLRLRLARSSGASTLWWFRLDRGFLDDVRLYHRHPDGRFEAERRTGDRVLAVGDVANRVPVFPILLTEPGVHEIYVRVSTASTMILQPSLIPQSQFLEATQKDYLAQGVYFGLCLALIVMGLHSAMWLRQRLFVYFLAYVASQSFNMWLLAGLGSQFFFAGVEPLADRLIATSICTTGLLGLLFYSELLGVERRAPWIVSINKGLYGLLAIAAAAPFFGLESRLTPYVLMLMAGGWLLLVWPIMLAWRSGDAGERWSCAMVVFPAVWSSWNLLLALGWIPAGGLADMSAGLANLANLLLLLMLLVLRTYQSEGARKVAEARADKAEAEGAQERQGREDQQHLLSMIAHEFRTPISIVDASLQSLRLLDQNAPVERQSRHDRISRAVARLNDLLELVLTRNRSDVSVWTRSISTVDLEVVTRDAIDIVGPRAATRFAVTVRDDTPDLQADERMLRYALLNLIDNALKYSPRGSRIDISIKPLVFEGRDGVHWSILDQGWGIPAADRERVFEKYYRVGERSDVAGLGLGLFLVRQIVQRHEGWVKAVAGEPGNGACFDCWLPRQQQ